MSKFIIVAVLAALAIAVVAGWDFTKSPKVLWQEWLNLHPHVRRLSAKQLAQRFQVFKKNLKEILADNKVDPEERQSLGPHAHVTEEEFVKWRTGGRPHPKPNTRSVKRTVLDISALPKSVDWRGRGRVAAIKNQGGCGSCWTFSAAAAIESAWAVAKNRKPIPGSQQQLLDCERTSSNGCKGGVVPRAIEYAASVGGLKTASSYPYKAKRASCRKFSGKIAATTSGPGYFGRGDYNGILNHVATKGPLSIGVHINKKWMHYGKGIISSKSKCSSSPSKCNHGVNIVGYGKKGGVPIWIVRNSWGKTWGYKGYALLKRGAKANTCGLHNWAVYSNV